MAARRLHAAMNCPECLEPQPTQVGNGRQQKSQPAGWLFAGTV